MAEAKAKLDAVKTDAEPTVDTLREEAVEIFKEYVESGNYSEEQKAEIEKIATEAKVKLDAATTPKEVSDIIAETQAKLDALKGDTYISGDANSDSKVNALDATQILRFANNKPSALTGIEEGTARFKALDVNGDGKINALDATQILRYANNKPSVLGNK